MVVFFVEVVSADRMVEVRTNTPYFAATVLIDRSELAKLDGRLPLRDWLGQLAATLNADPAAFTPTALAIIRRLIGQGFLLPAGF